MPFLGTIVLVPALLGRQEVPAVFPSGQKGTDGLVEPKQAYPCLFASGARAGHCYIVWRPMPKSLWLYSAPVMRSKMHAAFCLWTLTVGKLFSVLLIRLCTQVQGSDCMGDSLL